MIPDTTIFFLHLTVLIVYVMVGEIRKENKAVYQKRGNHTMTLYERKALENKVSFARLARYNSPAYLCSQPSCLGITVIF